MKTIALVLHSKWPLYYASSPYLNLFNASHPDFKLFAIQPHQLLDPVLKDEVYKHQVIITDDINAHMIGDFPGLRLMIGGDPHAHRPDQVERLIKEYNSVDYVLTGAIFCKQLRDRYLYPPAEMWRKHVYFPHMVPDRRPELPAWESRDQTALMSGSRDPSVYPFRAKVWELAKGNEAWISTLDLNNFNHDAYFQRLADFRFAVTCSSNFEYLVAKYMEIPWLGTILIAPALSKEESELIGFDNGVNVHWVREPGEVLLAVQEFNRTSLAQKMAAAGAELMKHHTAHRRLDYIKLLIERITQGNFIPDDAKDLFKKHRQGVVGGLERTSAP